MNGAHRWTALDLQDLLDGRLPETRRTELEAHVARCPACEADLAALRRVRAAVRSAPGEGSPLGLRERVVGGLDQVDRELRTAAVRRRRQRLGAGLLLATAASVSLLFLRPRESPLRTADFVNDLTVVAAQPEALEIATDQPALVEAFFRDRGIAFRTRVFDLGMMGYRVAGGAVRGSASRPRALFVYRASDGTELVCQMFEGRPEQLPPATETRENNGIKFRVYREGDVTLVFWQEGTVLCVMASTARPEDVIALAFAKAEKV